MDNANTVGLYGKIPALRDWVNVDLPEQFILGLDQWLQQSLVSSQQALGSRWLEHYLGSPVWRFALSSGVLGNQVWAGVMIPSVDKDGRYYPFIIAQPFFGAALPTVVWVQHQQWFEQLEQVALLALQEGVGRQQLQTQLTALVLPESQGGMAQWNPGRPLVMELGSAQQHHIECYPMLLHDLLQQRLSCYSLWRSAGNHQISPVQLVTAYLPSPQCYTSLIAGDWQSHGWSQPFPVASPLAFV